MPRSLCQYNLKKFKYYILHILTQITNHLANHNYFLSFFAQTGTLTEDGLDFYGIHQVIGGR